MSDRSDAATSTAELIVLALTNEFPNYSERVSSVIDCPITELWGIFLAATGRMCYVGEGTHRVVAGVINSPLVGGRDRFHLWNEALLTVIEILGDPEASFRTGYDTTQLRSAVTSFFREAAE